MLARAAQGRRVATSSLTARAARCIHASGLKERLVELMPEKQAALKTLKKEHGKKIVDKVTIDQLVGGARSIKSMLWETSLLDAEEGIRFRGFTIPELQQALPSYSGKQGDEPTPEGLFWLLLTGEVPTKAQADSLTAELHSRAKLPAHIEPMIRAFPKGMHPMTQLSSAILALQTESVFAREYAKGTHKSAYWDHTYEDMMNLIARLPEVAALIYRVTYFYGKVAPYDSTTDYSGNFCQMLGFNDPGFHELMRLYIVIHSDHEGGNASAHTCHLVGSTLSDPYLSLSACMGSLAGPLHGLANQDVLVAARAPGDAEGAGQGGVALGDHRVCVGHAEGWQGHPRLWPRRAPQDGPALHLAARVCAQAHAERRALQAGQHRLRGHAGRADGAPRQRTPTPTSTRTAACCSSTMASSSTTTTRSSSASAAPGACLRSSSGTARWACLWSGQSRSLPSGSTLSSRITPTASSELASSHSDFLSGSRVDAACAARAVLPLGRGGMGFCALWLSPLSRARGRDT